MHGSIKEISQVPVMLYLQVPIMPYLHVPVLPYLIVNIIFTVDMAL